MVIAVKYKKLIWFIVIILLLSFLYSLNETLKYPLKAEYDVEWVRYFDPTFIPVPHYYAVGFVYPAYAFFSEDFFVVCGSFWNLTSKRFNGFVAVLKYDGEVVFYRLFKNLSWTIGPVVVNKTIFFTAIGKDAYYALYMLDIDKRELKFLKEIPYAFVFTLNDTLLALHNNTSIVTLDGKVIINGFKNLRLAFYVYDNRFFCTDGKYIYIVNPGVKVINITDYMEGIRYEGIVRLKIIEGCAYLLGLGEGEHAYSPAIILKINLSDGRLVWRKVISYPKTCFSPQSIEKVGDKLYIGIVHQTDIDPGTVFAPDVYYGLILVLDDSNGELLWYYNVGRLYKEIPREAFVSPQFVPMYLKHLNGNDFIMVAVVNMIQVGAYRLKLHTPNEMYKIGYYGRIFLDYFYKTALTLFFIGAILYLIYLALTKKSTEESILQVSEEQGR